MSDKKTSEQDLTKEELTNLIFDTCYSMELNDTENSKVYEFLKLEYIALFEGKEEYAYDDAVGPNNPYKYARAIFDAGRKPIGKITVGAGFNMDRPEARAEWEKVLGKEISFDEVYRGREKINTNQMHRYY